MERWTPSFRMDREDWNSMGSVDRFDREYECNTD